MQFAVPQFTDVEDKLIGPLTLKQFLMLLGVAGLLFFFWSIFGLGPIFYIIALPTVGIGAYITFRKFNGRPFSAYVIPLISFLISPKAMVFMREPEVVSFTAKKMEKPSETKVEEGPTESAESRLKKLAYLLDRKAEQEEDLIKEAAAPKAQEQMTVGPQPGLSLPKVAPGPRPNLLNPIIRHVAKTLEEAPKPAAKSVPAPKPAAPAEPKSNKFNPSNILPDKIYHE